jgi:hypothetical protein
MQFSWKMKGNNKTEPDLQRAKAKKKGSAPKKKRVVAKRAKDTAIEAAEEKEVEDRRIAHAFLQPEMNAAIAIEALSPKLSEEAGKFAPLPAIWEELKNLTDQVAEGDSKHLERVAVAQITTLDAMFNNLVKHAWANYNSKHFEGLLKLGLKAQSQCARTIETLATLKNPSIIARQLNLANQQVVNYGPLETEPKKEREPPPPQAETGLKVAECLPEERSGGNSSFRTTECPAGAPEHRADEMD